MQEKDERRPSEDWLCFLMELSDLLETPQEDFPVDEEAILSDETSCHDYIIEDEFDEYYVTLQGIPFPDDAVLRCDYCLAPVEAYDGKLERCYVWFSLHRQSGDLECNGLVCKRCAEKRILPVKPAPITEDEKSHVNRLLSRRHSTPFLSSKINP